MRRLATCLAVLGLCLGFAPSVRAADDEVAKIIDKAIKAHMPKGVDKKNKGLRSKAKGTLHIGGMDLDFTQEVASQSPDKFKDVLVFTAGGQTITRTLVYNGKEAWIRYGDKDLEVTKEILAEVKEAVSSQAMVEGIFSKDKELKFSVIGEVKVKDKPAVGLKVSKKGTKDINVYFDKKTGLIVKTESRRRDDTSGEEVTEERIITEYQDADGRKTAKKLEILRDGKPFMEAEVTEVKILEKVDDNEFTKPQ
jgi:hypothetical protein